MIDEDIENNNLDNFDIEKAEKLLESIRFLSDLRRFPCQKPNSNTMEMTTVKNWVAWYAETTEWNGSNNTENEVMKLIYNLDEDLKLLTSRVEEGFQRLLTVMDRKDIKIKLLANEVNRYKEQIRMLESKDVNNIVDEVLERPVEEIIEPEPVIDEEIIDEPKPITKIDRLPWPMPKKKIINN